MFEVRPTKVRVPKTGPSEGPTAGESRRSRGRLCETPLLQCRGETRRRRWATRVDNRTVSPFSLTSDRVE